MRITTGIMKVALIVGLMAIAMFGIGLPAMAADGPTPPEIGDPTSGTQVVPHGGFGVTTNYCLQCHQVHYNRAALDPPGEYSLMAESSVTATCATCHGFEGNLPTGAEDPGFGGTIGTASTRAVYTESEEIHIIGAGFGAVGSIAGFDFYTWAGTDPNVRGPEAPSTNRGSAGVASYYNGGLFCGSCHTPHGEFGQLINSKWAVTSADQTGGANPVPVAARAWQDNTRIWWEDPDPSAVGSNEVAPNLDPNNPWKQVYLFFNSAPPGSEGWMVCTGSAGGGPCEYAQVLDAEGQLVSLYGYKLLTSSPNHQYPLRNSAGQYLVQAAAAGPPAVPEILYDPDDTGPIVAGSVPPTGLYSDAPFAGGTLARNAGAPNFLTHSIVGTLTLDIGPVATSIDVDERVTGTAVPTVPFKIRIDDEILMVTARTAPVSPSTTANYTVVRAVEPFEPEETCRPWGPIYSSGIEQFGRCAGVGHTAGVEVLLVPTLLVNEDSTRSVAQTLGALPPGTTSGNSGGLKPLASYGSSSRVGVPYHIKVTVGTTTEMMSVLWRTQVSGTQYLYTVGRAVDKTPSISAGGPPSAATFYVQSGVARNSVRSWGVDRYTGDMSSFCGSCHSGPVDVKFGGQYHSHPTGCAECHGSSVTAGTDFPHSSDSPFMLQALPDGLCLNCHVAGMFP